MKLTSKVKSTTTTLLLTIVTTDAIPAWPSAVIEIEFPTYDNLFTYNDFISGATDKSLHLCHFENSAVEDVNAKCYVVNGITNALDVAK